MFVFSSDVASTDFFPLSDPPSFDSLHAFQSRFLSREIEFDGIGRNGQVINYAISEHVEVLTMAFPVLFFCPKKTTIQAIHDHTHMEKGMHET